MLNEFSPLRLAEAEDACQFRERCGKRARTKNSDAALGILCRRDTLLHRSRAFRRLHVILMKEGHVGMVRVSTSAISPSFVALLNTLSKGV